jgi:hypothetical protein
MNQLMDIFTPDLANEVQQYVDETSTPLDELVNAAVSDWLEKQQWAVVNQGLLLEDEAKLHQMLRQSTVTDTERGAMLALADAILDRTIDRSRALAMLQKRGHDISPYLAMPEDEHRLVENARSEVSDQILDRYSDDQLWAIFHHFVPVMEQYRLRELKVQNESRDLTEEEHKEIDSLLNVLNSYMLVRSKALALLNKRGYHTDYLVR